MGAAAVRYVCKAIPDRGWRVWDRKLRRWWGNHYQDYPTALLMELNDQKRPDRISELSKGSIRPGNR